MSKKFSTEFKEQAVKKVLQRKENESIRDIAKSENVGFSTLTKWLQESQAKLPADKYQSKRPSDWTKEEKWAALMASNGLQDEELQHFCRHQGIFEHHLELWKNEFFNGTHTTMQKATDKKLNNKIQELERKITQKDKVIVEQAALLVLGKKLCAFWEEKKGS
jgi:transposase-like protein